MIKLEQLSKHYYNNNITLTILDNINLLVERGEFLSIMGPSGSGKSTLLNILGLLDQPTTGTYILDEIDVRNMGNNEKAILRNKKIGFVFQNFNLLPRLTALENVELPLIYAGVPNSERKKRAEILLGKVGLESRMYHRPNQLSGGQKQRVAIARALANNPDIILADEPTGSLDSKTSIQIINILKDINREGVTIIIVTHEEEVANSTNRQIILKEGTLVSDKRVV